MWVQPLEPVAPYQGLSVTLVPRMLLQIPREGSCCFPHGCGCWELISGGNYPPYCPANCFSVPLYGSFSCSKPCCYLTVILNISPKFSPLPLSSLQLFCLIKFMAVINPAPLYSPRTFFMMNILYNEPSPLQGIVPLQWHN